MDNKISCFKKKKRQEVKEQGIPVKYRSPNINTLQMELLVRHFKSLKKKQNYNYLYVRGN